MKISIEVDLDPSEFDLATDLLRTLRALTEHVKINKRSSTTGSAAAPRTLSGPVPTAIPIAVPIAAPTAVPVAAPTALAPSPVPIATPVPITQSAIPAQRGPASPLEARAQFTQLIASLADIQNLEPVAAQIDRIFSTTTTLNQTQLQDEFLEALFTVAFDPQHIAAKRSVAPYMYLLPKLPPQIRDAVKNSVMKKVLQHLNQKRPSDTRREEFLLQAEAFAVLCEINFVGMDGAVLTLEKLLKNSDRRAAAVTTLGKTVERCKDKVRNANPTSVASLFSVLDGILEEQFKYDIHWINDYMERQRPQQPAPVQPTPTAAAVAPPSIPTAAPVAAPIPVATPQTIGLPTSAVGPTIPGFDSSRVKLGVRQTFYNPGFAAGGTFFALGWDPTGQQLISGGKEVPLSIWTQDGMLKKTIDCQGMYICCVDVELSNQLILTCGMFEKRDEQQDLLKLYGYKSSISVYDGRDGQNFRLIGEIKRPEVGMMAAVKALPGTSNIVTSEDIEIPPNRGHTRIGLYDLHTVIVPGSNGAVQPVTVFTEHTDLVTCLAPLSTRGPGAFVSGSRDSTVKVWDARAPPAAQLTLGVEPGDMTSTTHGNMVTCVDTAGDVIVSGSLDRSIAAWDVRAATKPIAVAGETSVCNQHGKQALWNNQAILKVALEASPADKLVAVATVSGLYTVDFSTAMPVINAANAISADGTSRQYSDIKWARLTGQLYASAGDGASIDLLELRQA